MASTRDSGTHVFHLRARLTMSELALCTPRHVSRTRGPPEERTCQPSQRSARSRNAPLASPYDPRPARAAEAAEGWRNLEINGGMEGGAAVTANGTYQGLVEHIVMVAEHLVVLLEPEAAGSRPRHLLGFHRAMCVLFVIPFAPNLFCLLFGALLAGFIWAHGSVDDQLRDHTNSHNCNPLPPSPAIAARGCK
jgi:hypothetical protein